MSQSRAIPSSPNSKMDVEAIIAAFAGMSALEAASVTSLTDRAENLQTVGFTLCFDAGASDIPVSSYLYSPFPPSGEIESWELATKETGTASIAVCTKADLLNATNNMPTIADAITGVGAVHLSINTTTHGERRHSDTVTMFTTTDINPGDGIALIVQACTGIKRLYVTLNIKRPVP